MLKYKSSIFPFMSLLYHLSYSLWMHVFCVWRPIVAFCFACSYGMRYIAKVLKNSLHEKFPDASEDELLKVEALTCIHTVCVCVNILLMLCYCEHAEFSFILQKVWMMYSVLHMTDCRKPAVLPLHEPSHRGPRWLRHHRHVSRRAASRRPAS